ncbi:Hypothetical predicted protein [Lecanosticta acicola]|uniref:Uncharacterized protein n=1 Tax=Lecanosticta acicola TaxID=111012 RepID=A0AAI9E7I6_9PEZI|nr:Hypothetical predicted protein [Lecanosticta acicola]
MNQDSSGGSNAEMELFDWPSLDNYGFEDLGLSTPLGHSIFGMEVDTNLAFPYFGGGLGGGGPMPRATSYLVEDIPCGVPPAADDGLQKPCRPLLQEDETSSSTRENSRSPSEPATESANLLQTFYRLSVPSAVPGFSDDDLVSHYFNNVCTLYSCFDSDLNPFRTLVAEQWMDCKTTRLSIESMSVGHLANFYPHMASLGLAKRSQAWLSLQHDLQLLREGKQDTDRVLLCLLLQGLSSTWHQASNLGLQYLFVARGMIQTRLQQHGRMASHDKSSRNDNFFLDALLHWEMLASFVDPVPLLSLPGLKCPSLPIPGRQEGGVSPHPWTGVASTLHFILAEVGRILRRHRYVASPNLDARRKEHLRSADEEWAAKLEGALVGAEMCEVEDVLDYGDARTPKIDLVRMARAYRYVGLLELYAHFPSLLQERVGNRTLPKDLIFLSMATDTMGYASDVDLRLTGIATHILDSIKPVSIISAACRLLPLVLLSLASQLRLPDSTMDSQQYDEMIEARYFLEARMLTLSRKYAQRSVLQMMEIVKEVWSRLDSGTSGAHWMDVAHDRSWLTMFG